MPAGMGTIPEEVPTLSYWCFEPGVAMRGLEALKVRSVLLTSGTLSPLDSFAQELQLEFPLSLENPHVIADSQVYRRSPLDPRDTTHLGAGGLFPSPWGILVYLRTHQYGIARLALPGSPLNPPLKDF